MPHSFCFMLATICRDTFCTFDRSDVAASAFPVFGGAVVALDGLAVAVFTRPDRFQFYFQAAVRDQAQK